MPVYIKSTTIKPLIKNMYYKDSNKLTTVYLFFKFSEKKVKFMPKHPRCKKGTAKH